MKHRTGLLLLLAILLVSVPQSAPPNHAQSLLPPLSSIGLGFDPSSVQPVTVGVPIFTQGDALWVESYYNSTLEVQLVSPSGLGVTPQSLIGPAQLLQLYVFGMNDSSGVWSLSVNSSAPSFISFRIPIQVQSPYASLVPSLQTDSVTGNQLTEAFTIPATQAYDIQVCSAGVSLRTTASFGQSGSSNATLAVSLYWNASRISVSQTGAPITVWLELYSQYSYEVGGDTTSRYLLAASTLPTTVYSPIGSRAPQNVMLPLAVQMPLRTGRFDLRVFERTATGLSVQEALFIRMPDGSWLSMRDCTSLVSVRSQTFTLTTNLDSSNSSWPRELVTMYSLNGTESYSFIYLAGTESVLHLATSPAGGPLTGVAITPSASGCQLRDWDAFNSGVYLLTNGYPCGISLRLTFSDVTSSTIDASLSGAYSSELLSVPAGTMTASVTMNGVSFANATISVASPGGDPVAVSRKGTGSVSLLLPPNNYTLTASFGGRSVSQDFAIVAGQTTAINIELNPPGFPITLALVALVGLAGAIASIFVWHTYLERRKVAL